VRPELRAKAWRVHPLNAAANPVLPGALPEQSKAQLKRPQPGVRVEKEQARLVREQTEPDGCLPLRGAASVVENAAESVPARALAPLERARDFRLVLGLQLERSARKAEEW